ncbi:MAG: wax ester/triacylglycerol synthase domain-containing protein [Solirubrobacteraceae bacterium]|jgi:WS/DGAT/MGAT family acyltransferase
MTTPVPSADPHDLVRLTATEARLLELEDRRALHMHAGCVLVFEGAPPRIEELGDHVRSRLDLVPRYRQLVMATPFCLGPPVWVDDPHFQLDYHVRQTSLPGAGDEIELARLTGELLSRRLDRGKPLWELWLVAPVDGARFALIAKSHAALIDGRVNLDLLSVLLDEASAGPSGADGARVWSARPSPSRAALLSATLAKQARDPRTGLRVLRTLAARARDQLDWTPPPAAHPGAASALKRPVGLQRDYAHVSVGLGRLRKERARLGGTVNDAVLTAVAGAVGEQLRLLGEDTDGLALRALVPLADADSSRLLASHVSLPVGTEDSRRRHADISRALDGLRSAGHARPARELVEARGFAPPTTLGQAVRLQSAERGFDLVVTNVPGPHGAHRLLGHELREVWPAMPLARDQTLSVALISYAGRLHFGLLADRGALGDPTRLADLLERSTADLRKGGRSKRAARESDAETPGGRA